MDAEPPPVESTASPHRTESSPARPAALRVLADLRTGRKTERMAIDALLDRIDLAPRDRALAMELILGVARHRLTLSRILGTVAARGIKRINWHLQHILMLGAYQLIWLDGIPAFAAVDQAVRQAKQHGGPKAGRFVNGILRQLQRDIVELRHPREGADPTRLIPIDATTGCLMSRPVLPDPKDNLTDYLAAATSHPDWLVARWRSQFGPKRTAELCASGGCRPPLVLRPNRLRTAPAELAATLREEGFEPQLIEPDGLVVLTGGSALPQTEPYRAGWFQLQDRTAWSVGQAINPQAGQTILDLCAGVGTKATHLAELMDNRGQIIASDKNASRLRLLRTNAQRLGINIIQTVSPGELESCCRELPTIDWILVDVPCSNTGVLARRPEARYRLNARALSELTAVQRSLLNHAARLARRETRIVYSTCSVESDENETLVTRFLQGKGTSTGWSLQGAHRTWPAPQPTASGWHDGGYWAILARPTCP